MITPPRAIDLSSRALHVDDRAALVAGVRIQADESLAQEVLDDPGHGRTCGDSSSQSRPGARSITTLGRHDSSTALSSTHRRTGPVIRAGRVARGMSDARCSVSGMSAEPIHVAGPDEILRLLPPR